MQAGYFHTSAASLFQNAPDWRSANGNVCKASAGICPTDQELLELSTAQFPDGNSTTLSEGCLAALCANVCDGTPNKINGTEGSQLPYEQPYYDTATYFADDSMVNTRRLLEVKNR